MNPSPMAKNLLSNNSNPEIGEQLLKSALSYNSVNT